MFPSNPERGFSLLETLFSFTVLSIITAVVVPLTYQTANDIRLRGDAQAVNHMVGLAKMRAAAQFTRERLYVDADAGTFKLQKWDKTGSEWVDDTDETRLSSGITFSYGDIDEPPDQTQDEIEQSPACLDEDGIEIDGTSCIVFNSRGIPIDSNNSPYGNNALYVTDGMTGVYGTTISTTPLVRFWWTRANGTDWVKR